MDTILVPVHLVDPVWPHVSEGFKRASDRFGGDITVAELWTACRAGNVWLFVVRDDAEKIIAATVFRAERWRKGERFRCLAMYGERMKEWQEALFKHVTQVAKDAGCNGFVTDGREGIGFMFPNAKKVRSVFEMEI